MIHVELTNKEASALRRSAPVPLGATSKAHEDAHRSAVRKIRWAENGYAQGVRWVRES